MPLRPLRPLPLLLLLAGGGAGCQGDEGLDLESLVGGRVVVVLADGPQDPTHVQVSLLLQNAVGERCVALARSVRATLDGEPMEYRAPSKDPGVDTACTLPRYTLRVPRGSGPEASVVLLSQGDRELRVDVLGLTVPRGLGPALAAAQPLVAGERISLEWQPATDRFLPLAAGGVFFGFDLRMPSGPPQEVLSDVDGAQVAVALPAEMPTGEGAAIVYSLLRMPILRCDGFGACDSDGLVQQFIPVAMEGRGP
jgi:hypothetical protein